MSNFKIRILGPEDWSLYRTVRLNSLKDSPDSFGATYSREAEAPDSEWQSRLDPASGAKNALPLVSHSDGKPVGLAWGLIHDPDSTVAHLYQMWVSPDQRGKGVAKALLDRIGRWASGEGCHLLALSVAADTEAAVGLYSSAGFVAAGRREELRCGSPVMVQPMVKELHQLT